MKKSILSLVVLAFVATTVSGQIVSKKGENYLPEAGDYALGFDAVPLFNVFKFQNNATIGAASTSNEFTVFGKQFKSETEACRAGLGIGLNSMSTTDVNDNKVTQKNTNLAVSLGHEFRRGNTRIQGLYGAEGFLMLNSSSEKTEYDQDPTSTGVYPLETKNGFAFGIGVRGFVGVEYFVLPKLSVGLEYGIAFGIETQGRGETTTLNVVEGVSSDETTNDSGNKSFDIGLNTDVSGGAVKVLFHF